MPALGDVYTADFYDNIRSGSETSASQIAPVVVDLVKPASVIDVGCGDGTWLRAFLDAGVSTVLGIDGDYVDPESLRIPASAFRTCDLSRPPSDASAFGQFDLVLSLEVAEHLPPASSRDFVSILTQLGPVVLFSAAIPGQGGSNHINEQWQDYWAHLFEGFGYRPVDCIRKRFWNAPGIQYWYRQNAILYVREDYHAASTELKALLAQPREPLLPMVHPEFYTSVSKQLAYHSQLPSVGKLCGALPGAVGRAIGRRVGRRP